jgi:predicted ArsR family transcriptional regulator
MQKYICIIEKHDYNMTVDTMEITSRQRVFEAIRKHRLITVSELNLYLDMTPANIRHHLSVLRSDGLVEEIDSRKRDGRGRPETVYAVSSVFKEDGLGNLVKGILGVWGSSISPDVLNQNMQAIARHLAGNVDEGGNTTINKRLTACMDHLNKLHYQAHWEASHSGPRIRLGNCPYRKIIDQHPELCRMDKFLLEELVGFKISQVSKLERDERGSLYCSFIGH